MLVNFRQIVENSLRINKSPLLFRSGRFDFLLDDEAKSLVNNYNVKSYIDLRSHDEVKSHPIPKSMVECGIEWKHIPIVETDHYMRKKKYPNSSDYFDFYKYIFENNLDTIDSIITVIIDYIPGPVIIGCLAGKDRTGVIIMVFLLIFGFDFETIVEDYCKTTESLRLSIDCFEDSWLRKRLTKDEYLMRLVAHRETAEQFLKYLNLNVNFNLLKKRMLRYKSKLHQNYLLEI